MLRRLNGALLAALLFASGMEAQRQGGVAHTTTGNVANDGTQAQIDFPHKRRVKNVGGRDGAGLCVFTSIGMQADWQDVDAMKAFQKFMRSRPGGGHPTKVRDMAEQLCQEQGVPVPDYLQVEGDDLELIAKAIANGHMVAVTYSRSPTGRYNGQRIAHMVNLVAARAGPQKLWGVLDNNYIDEIEWMTEEQFKQSYTGMGGGWSVILLDAGPPLPPKNREPLS